MNIFGEEHEALSLWRKIMVSKFGMSGRGWKWGSFLSTFSASRVTGVIPSVDGSQKSLRKVSRNSIGFQRVLVLRFKFGMTVGWENLL